MAKKMEPDGIKELIIGYLNEYNSQEHPFLLFDLAHVNENDHTRVLLSILKFNNNQFLPSFLRTIGAPEYNGIVEVPTDQKRAIDGFIDLYFAYKTKENQTENQTEKFIIENKIYGAGDTYRQLARYIATVIPSSDDKSFETICENWKKGEGLSDLSHIHVVYLTADGSKRPSIESLPKYFGGRDTDESDFNENEMKINYYPINYAEDILPWLENEVLPNMPYSDNGIAIAGIRQYIESLKLMFSDKGNSKAVKKFVGVTASKDKTTYDKIDSAISILKSLENKKSKMNIKRSLKDIGYDVADLNLQPLIRDLRVTMNNLFSVDLNEGWKTYFTPTFVLLFKNSWWSESDIKKGYNFPSIHINCSPTKNIFDTKKAKITLKTKADHLPTDTKIVKLRSEWKFEGNRNRTISKDLQLDSQAGDYKVLFTQVVEKLKDNQVIKDIDSVIEKAKKEKKSYQEAVLESLIDYGTASESGNIPLQD